VLEQILPAEVAVAEAFADDPRGVLFPEEEAVIARAVGKRRREFTTGRACAHAALASLGLQAAALLPGPGGAPQWPSGVTGSITHCPGYRAAAVARTQDVAALGLDAEPDEALPGGVLEMIASGSERAQIRTLDGLEPGVPWGRLLFSAKESVYKAWFPLAQRWLGFDQAEITIEAAGTFAARLLVPGPLVAGSPLMVLPGRWLVERGLVATAVALPAGP
jgi:enterobactin synthetase component D / holo-[acyl-carrier protein] synthase